MAATKLDSPPRKPDDARGSLWRWVALLALVLLPILAGGLLLADWWRALPDDAQATYVGRNSCIECHQGQYEAWQGSPHDMAMDHATAETVLGDFNDAALDIQGVTSRAFKKDGKFFMNAEGPDGEMHDYEVKYVFGVEPLQQYLAEMERPADAKENELGRLQVLPMTWDTTRGEWYYNDPPDVFDERIQPGDRLHWTGMAANWNSMCADCHSTNLQKNFNVEDCVYRTTFSEIDVSCEACHGPGSLHVELAQKHSLFWDRKRGYALAKLKGEDSTAQIETCARCHVRRHRIVAPDYVPGEPFYDHFANELIREGAYYADGQIRDEVYVHGSFIQSKMFHKNVRCTDCHNPHSTKVKFEDNRLCTSCHQHPAGKYDTPEHHRHKIGSTGASCVDCHMPHTTYMEVDPRRDHSIRVPRPDLSVEIGTPNACTGCHIDATKLSPDARAAISRSHTREPLTDYASWMWAARETKDEEIRAEITAELDRLNAWSRAHTRKWYGTKTEETPHFAKALHTAWKEVPPAELQQHLKQMERELIDVVQNKDYPAMARASAVYHMQAVRTEGAEAVIQKSLEDPHPLVRYAALQYYEAPITSYAQSIRDAEEEANQLAEALAQMNVQNPQTESMVRARINQAQSQAGAARDMLKQTIKPPLAVLDDPVGLVRGEAGRVLAAVPSDLLGGRLRKLRRTAIDEYIAGLMADNNNSLAHNALALVYERLADSPDELAKAAQEYRTAIRIEPNRTGPRSNLAGLLERLSMQADDVGRAQKMHLEVRELRREESRLLGIEADQLPDNADLRYRYGLSLFLIGEEDKAVEALQRAHELAPSSAEILLRLALLHKERKQWDEAISASEKMLALEPQNAMYQHILRETRQEAAAATRPQSPE